MRLCDWNPIRTLWSYNFEISFRKWSFLFYLFIFFSRFFGFGGPAKKKSTVATPNAAMLQQQVPPSALSRRRGSDRSLSGSAHELAICGVSGSSTARVTHSHSQSNLSDIPYRFVPLINFPLPSSLFSSYIHSFL